MQSSGTKDGMALKEYHGWLRSKFKQFEEGQSKENPEIEICPLDDSMQTLVGVIIGPPDTIWEKAALTVAIHFPNFDFKKPPFCIFSPKVYHPNVSWISDGSGPEGHICLNMLKQNWTPMYSLEGILVAIRDLLESPNCDSPHNNQAAECYMKNRSLYTQTVKSNLDKMLAISFEERLKSIPALIPLCYKKPYS